MPSTNSFARPAILRGALALLLSIAAVGCGGGGGGGSADVVPTLSAPSTPVPIAAATGDVVTEAALEAVSGIMDSEGLGMVPMGAAAETDVQAPPHVLGRVTSQTLRRIVAAGAAPSVTGLTEVEPCASGNVVYTGNGTSLTATFNQCSDYPGEVINGYFAISSLGASGDGYVGSASARVRIDLYITYDPTPADPAGAITIRTAGGFDVAASWTPDTDTLTMSGPSLGWSDGTTTEVLLNFQIYESYDWNSGIATSSADFTLASTELGGAVAVDTVVPFETAWGQFRPYTGQLVVTGAGGGKVRVTVHDDESSTALYQLTIEIDADGNGSFETVLYRTWSQLW